MKAVYKHELYLYFRSITPYVFGAFLLALIGVGSLIYNINAAVANFEYVLGFAVIVFVILVPILTMRVFAEEKKQKTDQLLFSLPLTAADIVLGKYLALLTVFGISSIPCLFYPMLFKNYGDVYLPTAYGSLFAFLLLGVGLIAVGMFISTLTESQGLAAGICVAVMLFMYYSVSLADYVSSGAFGSLIVLIILLLLVALIIYVVTKNGNLAYIFAMASVIVPGIVFFINSDIFEGLIANIMKTLSIFERFSTFVNGVFDISGIVFMLSYATFFVFLTVQSLEKRRYN